VIPSLPAQALTEFADQLTAGQVPTIDQDTLDRAWGGCPEPGPMLDVLLRHREHAPAAPFLPLGFGKLASPAECSCVVRVFVPRVLLTDLEPRRPE
jgi:hypothetical protein